MIKNKEKERKKLRFEAPKSFEDAFEVIIGVSIYLDFWIGRKEDWYFVQLLSKSVDSHLWNIVSKCVVTDSGLSLQGVSFQELGVAGVLEALCVFSNGMMELEVPDIYLHYCPSIETKTTLSLIKDAERLKKELEILEDPGKVLSHLTSKLIAGSI